MEVLTFISIVLLTSTTSSSIKSEEHCLNEGTVDYSRCYGRFLWRLDKAEKIGDDQLGSESRCCAWRRFGECVHQLVAKFCPEQAKNLERIIVEAASIVMHPEELDQQCLKFKAPLACRGEIVDAILALLAILVILALFWWSALRLVTAYYEMEAIQREMLEMAFHEE